ncbi:hypothetical protein Dimus_038526 [Dionaea muscipula]
MSCLLLLDSSENLFLNVGIYISIGITASAPYTSENEVEPAEFRTVVRYDHTTPSSSSAHLPLALSSLFLSVEMIVLLVDSACPFSWGYLGVEKFSLIPQSLQKS